VSDPTSPLLCTPEQKAELEVRNGSSQLEYIDYLVCQQELTQVRESHVREFQRLAVEDIYPCGGSYRDATKKVVIQNSQHELPPASSVPFLVQEAVDWVNAEAGKRSALERAAFALWRLNWVHPFAGGNGRTSRAVAYLIVCMDARAMLPGTPSMPSLIYDHREEYIRALRATDESVSGEEFDLSVMTDYLKRMLVRQLAHAVDALSSPGEA